jgi:hypothetical protein
MGSKHLKAMAVSGRGLGEPDPDGSCPSPDQAQCAVQPVWL